MAQIIVLYTLLFLSLLGSWHFTGKSIKHQQSSKAELIYFIVLVIIITFRDGTVLRDYSNYVMLYEQGRLEGIEASWRIMCAIPKFFGTDVVGVLFLYAILSIGIRFYAIIRYSPFILFSLSVWFSSTLLLHDMIQIRAAISSALLLLLLPLLYERRWMVCVVLFLVAFFFHRSAIIFLPLFFLSHKRTNWIFWVGLLILAMIFNILQIDIIGFMGLNDLFRAVQLVEGDIYNIKQAKTMVNLFSPLAFLQIITCCFCIYRYERIKIIFPSCGLFIKTAIIGIIINSLSLGVVSTRLAELLSVTLIFLYPCAMLWYTGKYSVVLGKATVSMICIFILTNYIFLQHFIEL